jgi:hypothetical protein
VARRAVEADHLALGTLAILCPAICDLSDDPVERIRLLKATVWVMVGRLLSAWSPEEQDREWAEAKAAVMDVADQMQSARDGKERVQ